MSKREIFDLARAAGLEVDEKTAEEMGAVAHALRESRGVAEFLSASQMRELEAARDLADVRAHQAALSTPAPKKKSFLSFRTPRIVDLMIFLFVVGGLFAILTPPLTGRFGKAQSNEAKIQMKELVKQLDLFYSDCGRYPNVAENLEALVSRDRLLIPCQRWREYMKRVPTDPWNRAYIYWTDGGQVRIRSLGRDGNEGGSGNDADISSDDL